MADVFLSYAPEDRERAFRLVRALEDWGFTVWWDVVVPPGRNVRDVIERELHEAKCVVVLWSRDSVSSRWTQETAVAAANRGTYRPTLIDDVQLPGLSANFQTLDLTGWDASQGGPEIEHLVRVVADRVGRSPREFDLPRTAPSPSPRRRSWTSIITAPVGVVIGLGGAVADMIREAAGSYSEARRRRRGVVILAVTARAAVRPAEEFTARFVAYVKAMEAEVQRTLAALGPSDRPAHGAQECNWKVGTHVTVRFAADHVEVTDPQQSFEWNGSWQLLNFDCRIPADAPEGVTILKYDVYVADIRVAKLRIDLRIAKNAKKGRDAKAQTQSARSAFASYDSADRLRVLDRVDELEGIGMDVFVDCLSLHPNESWKPRLQQEITDRELFLLYGAKRPSLPLGSNGNGEWP